MTRRAILNVTTTKKQDNRLQTDLVNGNFVPATSYGMGAANIFSGLYIPTAMDRDIPDPHVDLPSYRTSGVCYMRGYQERVTLVNADDTSWQWRRITFTFKGLEIMQSAVPNDGVIVQVSPQGYTRPFIDMAAGLRNRLTTIVFKGTQGRDWQDVFQAKIDTQRVTLKSDVTRIIAPKTQGGSITRRKLWYPMNANLVYNEDESGTDVSQAQLSVSSKAGMGDYYIWDLFRSNDATGTILAAQVSGTLYWHEK